MPIRVLLADRHMLMLEGLRRALAGAKDIEIVGETTSGRRLVSLVGQLQPDVVLVDLHMAQIDGLTSLEMIHTQFPRVKVVITHTTADPEEIREALRRGANAFIVKTISPLDLPAAIRQVVEGTFFHALTAADPMHTAASAAGLTDRQLAILSGVARGLTNEAIAHELWVTEQTVKYHLTNIYRKLGVRNRTAAAQFAYRHHLINGSTREPH